MATNTKNLNLYKADPIADGNSTFNINTMLNDNWDKIDGAMGKVGALMAESAQDLENHVTDTEKHVTSTDKTNWNAKETTTGAQEKADTAETNAKTYTDTKTRDVGRYQGYFGFDNFTYTNTNNNFNKLEIGKENSLLNSAGTSSLGFSSTLQGGQRFFSNFFISKNIRKIKSFSVFANGSITYNNKLICQIFDVTTSTILASKELNLTTLLDNQEIKFLFDSLILINKNNTIDFRLFFNNSLSLKESNSSVVSDSLRITSNNYITIVENTSNDLNFKIEYIEEALTGAAKVIIDGTNAEKYGNIKFNSTLNDGTVTVKITDIDSNTVKKITQNTHNTALNVVSTSYVGQLFEPSFLQSNGIGFIKDFKIYFNSPASNVTIQCIVYDRTSNSLLATKNITIPSGTTESNIIFDTPVQVDNTHRIEIKLKTVSGILTLAYSTSNVLNNSSMITTVDNPLEDIKFEMNTLSKYEIIKEYTATNGVNYIDLEDIDIKTYSNLVVEFSLNIPSLDKISPVLRDFSYTVLSDRKVAYSAIYKLKTELQTTEITLPIGNKFKKFLIRCYFNSNYDNHTAVLNFNEIETSLTYQLSYLLFASSSNVGTSTNRTSGFELQIGKYLSANKNYWELELDIRQELVMISGKVSGYSSNPQSAYVIGNYKNNNNIDTSTIKFKCLNNQFNSGTEIEVYGVM